MLHYQGEDSLYEPFKNIYLKIYNYFLKKKWSILYSSIGITKILDLSNNNSEEKKKSRHQSIRVINDLKSKMDVLKINFLGINVGELIYDTYLRYRGKADLDIKDNYLQDIIYKSFLAIFKGSNLSLMPVTFALNDCDIEEPIAEPILWPETMFCAIRSFSPVFLILRAS